MGGMEIVHWIVIGGVLAGLALFVRAVLRRK